ncbi:MAG: DUF2924 domain-containing protein [Beijerinckiaceae bacterium]
MPGGPSNRNPGSRSHRGTGIIDAHECNPANQIASELKRLQAMDEEVLKHRWSAAFGKPAPNGLPIALARSILIQGVQTAALGGLDKVSAELLDRIAKGNAERNTNGRDFGGSTRSPKTLSELGINDERRGRLQPGTVLVREHDGAIHHVMVLADGFSWNGETYTSLSKVAFAVTGTKWNGRRFFGLDQPKPARGTKPPAKAVSERNRRSAGSPIPCEREKSSPAALPAGPSLEMEGTGQPAPLPKSPLHQADQEAAP